MDKLRMVALSGCLLVGGCAGPMDRSWDDPVYREIRSRYHLHDEGTAGLAANDAPTEPAALPLDELDALSVNDAIRVAINNAPSLRRAGYRVDFAAGRVIQAGLYPNPTIGFDGEGLGSGAGSGGETIYRVEQEIVLGGKLDKARQVAEVDQLSAQAGFVAEEFAVAARVTRAYYETVAARERLENRRELLDLSDRLLEAATAQVDAGAATEPDRLRAEVIRDQARIEHESARLAYEASKQNLASAMGLERLDDLPLSSDMQQVPTLPNLESFLAASLESNSRIKQAQLAIDKAQKVHTLARAEAMPDLVVSAGPRYSDIENETTIDLGIGIEIPLFDRNQGNIRAAVAERLSSAAALREVQLKLIAEVSRAYADYESARIAVDRYREQLLQKAERTLELTRQAYERGKTDYLRLLDAQQVVIESRIAYVDAWQRLHEAAAMLHELAQTDAPWRDSTTERTTGGTTR